MTFLVVGVLLCSACEQQKEVRESEQAQVRKAQPPPPELTPDEAATIPPFPPTNVTVNIAGATATLTWDPSPLENVVKYRIYEKNKSSKWVKIAETSASKFIDKTPQPKGTYSITAVNVYGAESPPAEGLVKKAPY